MKRDNPQSIIWEETTFMPKTRPYNRNVISFSGIFFKDFVDVLIKYSEEVL